MNTIRQAGKILQSWERADFSCFHAELEDALILCRTEMPDSQLEYEQQAVLESVARHFHQLVRQTRTVNSPQHFEAGLFLLRHLRSRSA